MIEHLVLFKVKADADAAAITAAFLGLKAAIPAIHEISFGPHCAFLLQLFRVVSPPMHEYSIAWSTCSSPVSRLQYLSIHQ
jgi:hypothetical protein